MARFQSTELRSILGAGRFGDRAPCPEGAAAWDVGRAWGVVVEGGGGVGVLGQGRGRGEQRFCVGVRGGGEDLFGGAEFGDAAEIHDRDAIAHAVHDRQVVADENVGQVVLGPQVAHEFQDRCLDRQVEAGGRLVEDHDARAQGQGAGEADAALLAAGQFMRIARPEACVQPHRDQHLVDPAAALLPVVDAVDLQRFFQRIADPPPGIERRARILVHVLDVGAGNPGRARIEAGDRRAIQPDRAVGLADQAQKRLGEGRLAASGFADKSEHFAVFERQGDAVDRLDERLGPGEQRPRSAEMRL